ncbi:MAG: hypothetical protein LBK40_06575 [Spirochaetaceae bacterium]|jgi:hypothetical protein|nr:hypothetical protein [Spirochaetaceae bacterium]
MITEKPTVLCSLVALVLALGFGFLVYRVMPKTGSSYGVLRVDLSYSDRFLRSLLDGGGIAPVISESGQRVFYDAFGGIEAVPLDRYRERIDSRDPRDDGYAEKLRSAFTDSEARLLFFPRGAALGKKISSALADIPHNFEAGGFSRPLVFPLVVFALASLLMLFLFRPVFVFALPLLGVLSWFGPQGFVLAALLCLIFDLLAPVMEEWAAFSVKRLAASALLVLLWAGLFFAGGIPLPVFPVLPLSLFLAWLSPWRKKALARHLGHKRFIPLSIIPEQGLFRKSFPILLPFALGAALVFAFPLFFRGVNLYDSNEMQRKISVTRADFERHLAFQKDFSYRPLGSPSGAPLDPFLGAPGEGYAVYTLDGDGLIGAFTALPRDAAMPRITAEDTALFTLFENPAAAPAVLPGLLWTAGLCALLLPAWFLRGRRGTGPAVSARYSDRRIAA